MTLAITACTATSAMGHGMAATLDSLRAGRSGLRPCDFADVTEGWIGRVDGLESHRLPAALAPHDCRNNRLADLALRADGFAGAVAEARGRYGAARIGLVLGTSTSGILAGEEAYRDRDEAGALPGWFDHARTQDTFSLADYVRRALALRGPAFVVSVACASGASAFADARHLVLSGACDAAVVGGADTLCRMTLRGFAALQLVAPEGCRPCDADRDGISVGEAAGFALLEPDDRAAPGAPRLLGCGASSDGHHIASPDPEGRGAALAMRAALRQAGLAPDAIDLVNLHGTGTRANDAMEDKAVAEVLGAVPASSTKGWSGHTLGAAGMLEAAIALLCIRHQLMPGCLRMRRRDPAFRARVLAGTRTGPVRRVMSNSFGFGGINCSLVLGAP